ncbi:MAG: hypothetical protein JO265_03560 [Acidimicrobiia bacterium]|nr:hypothetical protein [Acidimicrobiia bacterium]
MGGGGLPEGLGDDVLTNPASPRVPDALPKGTPVRVRNTLGSWAGGFEVVSGDAAGYLLRRVSDGALLPTPIGASEVARG